MGWELGVYIEVQVGCGKFQLTQGTMGIWQENILSNQDRCKFDGKQVIAFSSFMLSTVKCINKYSKKFKLIV